MSYTPLTTNPSWIKIASKSYTDFSETKFVNTIPSGYSLPANTSVLGCFVNPTTIFLGGLIASYTISVGVGSGAGIAKYAVAQNVFTGATLQNPQTLAGIESLSTDTSITITATSSVGDLSAATQGSVDIYMLVSTIFVPTCT